MVPINNSAELARAVATMCRWMFLSARYASARVESTTARLCWFITDRTSVIPRTPRNLSSSTFIGPGPLALPTFLTTPSAATLAALPLTLGQLRAIGDQASLYANAGFTAPITSFTPQGYSNYNALTPGSGAISTNPLSLHSHTRQARDVERMARSAKKRGHARTEEGWADNPDSVGLGPLWHLL